MRTSCASQPISRAQRCAAARIKPDQERVEDAKRLEHTLGAKRPANNDLSCLIGGVNLKQVLGKIETASGNLHVDAFSLVWLRHRGPRDAAGGGVHINPPRSAPAPQL